MSLRNFIVFICLIAVVLVSTGKGFAGQADGVKHKICQGSPPIEPSDKLVLDEQCSINFDISLYVLDDNKKEQPPQNVVSSQYTIDYGEGGEYLNIMCPEGFTVSSGPNNHSVVISKQGGNISTSFSVSLGASFSTIGQHNVTMSGFVVFADGTTAPATPVTTKVDVAEIKITGDKYVCVGDSITLVGSGGTKPYSWSSSATDIATVSDGGVVTGMKIGKTTITVADVDGKSATHDVIVVKLTIDHDLWWFNGEKPDKYNTTATLKVEGVDSGSLKWEIVAGDDKISLGDNGKQTITVETKKGSKLKNDVSIKLTSDGDAVGTVPITVLYPAMINKPIITDLKVASGFRTEYDTEVTDQFGNKLPNELPVNETFFQRKNDMPNNWANPVQTSGMTVTGFLIDQYSVKGGPPGVPEAVKSTDGNAGVKVFHFIQAYRAGSQQFGKGILLKSHTVQFYRGKGRQE